MTIQDLGSIGELVAAVGTILTLVYLAVQIRQNTKMVGVSVAQAHRDARNDTMRFLATDPETARVYRHGLRDPKALTEAERFMFDAQMAMTFNYFEQAHGQDTLQDHTTTWFLSQPGVWAHLDEFGDSYSTSLRTRLQPQIGQAKAAAAQQSAAADSAQA